MFLIAAVASAWAGWLIARVDPEPTPVDEPADAEGRSAGRWAGCAPSQAKRDLRLLFVLIGVQTFMRGAITVLTVVVAVELVGMGDAGVGALNAALGAGAVLASAAAALLVGSRRLAAWFGLGVVLWGRRSWSSGSFPSAAGAMLMLAVVGAGNALIDVGGFTLIARIARPTSSPGSSASSRASRARRRPRRACVTPLIIDALDLRTALVVLGLYAGRHRPGLAAAAGAGRRDRRARRGAALLRGVPLLEVLPLPALETVARQLDHVVVPAGETVFRQGDPGDRFYVVVEGTAQVEGDGRRSRPGAGRLVRRDRAAAAGARAPRRSGRSRTCAWSRCAGTGSWP